MKAINKEIILATAYKTWLDNLENEDAGHPEYKSSTRYYYDIVANLLWVQGGLCAYTEMFLADHSRFRPDAWIEGRIAPFETFGQLDHYDSTLKADKGWSWDNFFVIHSDINTKRKRSNKVNGQLKPDKTGFDPSHYLRYDIDEHFFIPNIEGKSDEQINLIEEDINALGLNYEPVVDYRKLRLAPLFNKIGFGLLTIEDARNSLNSIYTAFDMGVSQINP
jgi:hypothetical protein